MSNKPSTFDLQFVSNQSLYHFGFSVDDQRIVEEWLVRVIGNTETPIYERRTSADGRVEVEAPDLKKESEKLAALVTLGGPENQSFLATARASLRPQDLGAALTDVIGWLDTSLTLVGPVSRPLMLGNWLAMEPEFRDFASGFLSASATGVDSIRAGQACSAAPGGADLFEMDGRGGHCYRIAIQAIHGHAPEKEIAFELAEEFDGTRRLLSLMPALHQMSRGSAVLIIAESCRSMHPMLVYKRIEYFLNAHDARPSQLIATTHETHLLTLDLLRRDEVWFAEKDRAGATNLYSLTDFKVRNDRHIRDGYLEGRFGAVPFLGGIDRLIDSGPQGAARN